MQNWRPEFASIDAADWGDRPVAVIGTGASMKGFDFERLRGRWRVLAVKESWRDLPFADTVFGLDIPWMNWAASEIAALCGRMNVALAVPDQELALTPISGPLWLKRTSRCDALSDDPTTIECGGNSGFGAFNFAYLKGAKRIVLFGFDYGGAHYCEDRYVTRPPNQNSRYMAGWARNFDATRAQLDRAGVSVLNASPSSLVDAFPKVSHEEALQRLHRL